jgi:hypothetical protein
MKKESKYKNSGHYTTYIENDGIEIRETRNARRSG